MVNQKLIMQKINSLVSILRSDSKNSIADRIDELMDEQAIWDKMALKLSDELEYILSTAAVSKNIKILATELLSDLGIDQLKELGASVYDPIQKFANQLGAQGFVEWQAKIENAISSGSTSTEIFMALRWNFNEMLKTEKELSDELRRKAKNLFQYFSSALNS